MALGTQRQKTTSLQQLESNQPNRSQLIEQLYIKLARRLEAYMVSRGLAADRATDLVQDVFVRALKSLPTAEGSSLEGWLWRVAKNVLVDEYRQTGRVHLETLSEEHELDGESFDDWISGLSAPIDDIALEQLRQCVSLRYWRFREQSPDRAEVVEWAILDELDGEQVSTLIGRTAGATREFLSQSKKKLKTYLAPCLALLDRRGH
ncbi:MAG: RNA polymerase sigma factor [Stagnimonas sp.]|nr:RNA polymerase sigma factor [Stagnimonas sp.]